MEGVVVGPLVPVDQHVVRRLDLQEAGCFVAAGAVRVVKQRELAVRLLDLRLVRIGAEVKRLVEVEVVGLHPARLETAIVDDARLQPRHARQQLWACQENARQDGNVPVLNVPVF